MNFDVRQTRREEKKYQNKTKVYSLISKVETKKKENYQSFGINFNKFVPITRFFGFGVRFFVFN